MFPKKESYISYSKKDDIMNFRIDYTYFQDYGFPIYRKSEQSFDFDPYVSSNFSLMLGASYTSLEIDLSDKKVLYLSGLSPQKSWIRTKIVLPQFKKGTLYVENLKDCLHGMGIETINNFNVNYDKKTGWIFFYSSDEIEYNQCVMFARNTIVALNNDVISAIWVKPNFIK